MPTVYIIHGYTAAPTKHWFPWLKEKLGQDGAAVHIPAMPDSTNPDAAAWHAHLDQTIPAPDAGNFADSYFVGHSLGCITLLNYLCARAPQKIGGLVLVAGFTQKLPAIPLLDPFTAAIPDMEQICTMTKNRAVVLSNNDMIVPPDLTADLAAALQVTPDIIANGGHFLGNEGFTQLPVVYRHLQNFMQNAS